VFAVVVLKYRKSLSLLGFHGIAHPLRVRMTVSARHRQVIDFMDFAAREV
jgi:tetraacyldisaccharide-1-P 4'-kinase